MKHASLFAGGVATKNEEIGAVARRHPRPSSSAWPTRGRRRTELENAKSYLTGSYALRFDTNAKIANQLLGILVEDDLGIDYVDKRNAEVEAVTLDDVKRVAKRLLETDELIVHGGRQAARA